MLVLIAKRAHYQSHNLSNLAAPGSGMMAFDIDASLLTCCSLSQSSETSFPWPGFCGVKEQVVCVFILDKTTSELTTWSKTIVQEEGKSMHLTTKISGGDSCTVALK